ncbi:hypothetical protein [Pseudomonas chlororaphis]|uniref:hypothetical protein n=1 Tax=Pseudomonas chlororaphis TaxID=587753 RepID=UPI0003D2CBF2|nr:hypothetical protein [Pseudomonas chlororaphis]AZD29300.1 hypothetical protein C4K23_2551 [Pseudomonas chlororaphis]ETD37908.1 hypothetical protein U724_20700 [Pseudomonas chlororaphis subsp. aurantiaca PB-St2]QFS54805.1 hypothetical protein FD951_09635 [Pseudomonas chlororaphis subsp. aurantiaca]
MGSLKYYEEILGKNGLTIPPFSNFGILDKICAALQETDHPSDERIGDLLSEVYNARHLAAMVLDRYPNVPIIAEYRLSIAESVEAHFLGLGHVAVAGLMPVVEGAGRLLYEQRGLGSRRGNGIVKRFQRLTNFAICEINEKQWGDYSEVESMLSSFQHFLKTCFFSDSDSYPLADNTNRNGVTHGFFTDKDFGSALNFYKTIGAIDMLCLISTFQVFPPLRTPESEALAMYYLTMRQHNNARREAWGKFLTTPLP